MPLQTTEYDLQYLLEKAAIKSHCTCSVSSNPGAR